MSAYHWTTEQARLGNLGAVRSPRRAYGYTLAHLPSGATAMWFRRKRDALQRIAELRDCPNTPHNGLTTA